MIQSELTTQTGRTDQTVRYDAATCDHKIWQSGKDGTADMVLSGVCIFEADHNKTIECNLVYENSGAPVADRFYRMRMTSGADGAWSMTVKNVPAGGMYRFEINLPCESGTPALHDLGVGEVWMVAGQSNSSGCTSGFVDDPPMIGVNRYHTDGYWLQAVHPFGNGNGHSSFLQFGKLLRRALNVPIGIIPLGIGGSGLNQWFRLDRQAQFYTRILKHTALAGSSFRGMIWYQGCTDAMTPEYPVYGERFASFVESLRKEFNDPEMPVIVTQLNKYTALPANMVEAWSIVKEYQRMAPHTIANCAVVPTIDLSLSDAIHTSASGNMLLAERYANAALGMTYGMDVSNWKAPDIASAVRHEEDGIILSFDNCETGICQYYEPAPDFLVEDSEGIVPVSVVKIAAHNTIRLKLARKLGENATISTAIGGNPETAVRRVPDQMPLLGFYRFKIT